MSVSDRGPVPVWYEPITPDTNRSTCHYLCLFRFPQTV
jgi:hypothetical protein